jgi:2'-5' RNA ligase
MPNENVVIRSFLAIYPTPEAYKRIIEFRDRLRSSMNRSGVRWASEGQLHLTVKFVDSLPLMVVPELVERLQSISEKFEPIPLKASFIGPLWQNCRVLGLSIDSPDNKLVQLQQCMEDVFFERGVPKEPKAFNPHLTLARIDHARLIPVVEKKVVAEWTCSEWVFVKSELTNQGAIHTPIADIKLG